MYHLLLIYRLAFYSLLKNIYQIGYSFLWLYKKVTKQEFEAVYSSSFLASAHKERTIKFYSGVSLF